MLKMQDFSRTLMIAALATTPVAAITQVAQAEDLKVRVGDLSRSDGARAFNQRVDRAADSFCSGSPAADLGRLQACRAAVRDEALAQLSAAQRAQVETPRQGMAQVDPEQASMAMASAAH
jgi:UrcA family protein